MQQLDVVQKNEELKLYRNGLEQLLPWELLGYCKRCGYKLGGGSGLRELWIYGSRREGIGK